MSHWLSLRTCAQRFSSQISPQRKWISHFVRARPIHMKSWICLLVNIESVFQLQSWTWHWKVAVHLYILRCPLNHARVPFISLKKIHEVNIVSLNLSKIFHLLRLSRTSTHYMCSAIQSIQWSARHWHCMERALNATCSITIIRTFFSKMPFHWSHKANNDDCCNADPQVHNQEQSRKSSSLLRYYLIAREFKHLNIRS